jgi:putative ubiquitin-RnfH superfamily antitoxin RatB of RatAB toxin-antitoxin module
MNVGIAYVAPDSHVWLRIEVPEGATVREAIARSGILLRFPEIDLSCQKVGIFGKLTRLDGPVSEGDRVEIYRPITADPETVPRRDPDAQGRR